jgi:hypothetical protein
MLFAEKNYGLEFIFTKGIWGGKVDGIIGHEENEVIDSCLHIRNSGDYVVELWIKTGDEMEMITILPQRERLFSAPSKVEINFSLLEPINRGFIYGTCSVIYSELGG